MDTESPSVLDVAFNVPPFLLYVRPFYLSLLHANFASGRFAGHGDARSRRIARAASRISDSQLKRFFKMREWRGRLTAAWFVGLSQRSSFVDKIGELLLKSELVYAGQGYCVAMGLIGGESCQAHLRAYLRTYLPYRGRYYDQRWAIGALAHIQGAPPQEFLDPPLWVDAAATVDPLDAIQRFGELAKYVQQHRMITSRSP